MPAYRRQDCPIGRREYLPYQNDQQDGYSYLS